MSGRSRRWVCCLAAVLLMAVSGWRVTDTASALVLGGPGNDVVRSVGSLLDGTKDPASVHNRRVAAEPAAAKRVEIERLAAVAVAAAIIVLALAARGLAVVDRVVRRRLDRSRWRTRAPPLAFVS
jgi:hypothetical protein